MFHTQAQRVSLAKIPEISKSFIYIEEKVNKNQSSQWIKPHPDTSNIPKCLDRLLFQFQLLLLLQPLRLQGTPQAAFQLESNQTFEETEK